MRQALIGFQATLFVALGVAALCFLTVQLPAKGIDLSGPGRSYRITAEFDDAGNLKVGAPVTIAGVPIGQVEGIDLDRSDYRAFVAMRISAQWNRIPDDSSASIDTQGLLGGQYVVIGAGRSQSYLRNGSRLELTHSAFVLENVVSRLFTTLTSKDAGAGSKH